MKLAKIAQAIDDLTGSKMVTYAITAGIWVKTDLSRASGLTMARLAELENGKRPTKAERAAIKWALAVRLRSDT